MQNFISSLFGSNNSGSIASSFNSFSDKYGKKKTIVPTNSTSVGAVGTKGGYDTAPGIPTSTVGATSTKPVPQPQVASSPAKTAFVNSLASQNINGVTPNPTLSENSINPDQPQTPPPPDPNASYRSAFDEYIKSLKPSDAETRSAKSLSDLKLQNQQEYDAALERPGETIGSAAGEGARVNRNYSYAIDAESNRLNALTGNQTANNDANKARVDFEKSLLGDQKPFQAGDTTYQYDPATGQYKSISKKADANAGFTLSPGENRYDAEGKLIASGGVKPPTQAQETAAIAKTEKEQATQQSTTQSLGLINSLLSGDRYKAISGATQTGSIPFLGDRAAVNEYDQLQGLLKLGVRSLIKGQGAVSDYEGKVLGQAASSLSRLTSESQFKEALQKVRGVLQTNNGGETDVIIKDKNGKVLGQGSLNGDDIYEAINDGNTVEYL